jgi:tripartite-type tricarboxylate transporter receptor subunit TctC
MRVLLGAVTLVAGTASAQPVAKPVVYPAKPMRYLVGYTPGGTTDYVARTLAQKITDYTGQPVPVDNRPSANGAIAAQMTARATPDGYTLLQSTSGHSAIPAAVMGSKLSFDPFRELAPIVPLVLSAQIIVVHPGLNVKSIPDLVRVAKARPGELTYGSAGVGTPNHLGIELLKHMAGFDMTHVPYKGGSSMAVDLASGRVHLALNSMITLIPFVKTGKLVPIAVGTAKRSPAMPDLPTVAESGYPDYQVSTWYGLFTTAGTPRAHINTMNALVNRILAEPQIARLFSSQGVEPQGGTPEDMARLLRSEYERWKKLLAATKLKVE